MPKILLPNIEPAAITGLPIPAPTNVDMEAIVLKTFFTELSLGFPSSGLESLYRAKLIVSLFAAAPCQRRVKSSYISASSSSISLEISLDILLILKSA